MMLPIAAAVARVYMLVFVVQIITNGKKTLIIHWLSVEHIS